MAKEHAKTSETIFTIGHSTHPIEEFADILKAHGIEFAADVRTIPKSRHNPQYNSDALAAALRWRYANALSAMSAYLVSEGFVMRRKLRSIWPGKMLPSGDLRIICKQKNSMQA